MDFIINENQLKAILREQDESKMTNYMKRLYSFSKEVVNRVEKKYDINTKMLLTWGTSVGGLVLPLDNFIRNGNFNMTDDQRYLVLAGIASILFFGNKKTTKELIKKITEEGLKEPYTQILSKAKELESAFMDFLISMNVSVGTFLDTVAYSFLLPIITNFLSISTIQFKKPRNKENGGLVMIISDSSLNLMISLLLKSPSPSK
jgi:hypothetical protein